MFGAFTDRENVRVGCPHGIVDDDAAPNAQVRCLGELHAGANAHRHHEDVAWQDAAIFQPERGDFSIAANNLLGLTAKNGFDAPFLQRFG